MKKEQKNYRLDELAELTQSTLIGDATHQIQGVADLESATPMDVSFLANDNYLTALKDSKAGLVCVTSHIAKDPNKNYLVSENPSRCFQQILELFHPQRTSPSGFEGIHPTAVVHPTATLGKNITLGPHVTIDEEVVIGNNTFIGAGCYIGPQAIIGESCIIHPRVVVREECVIGNRVVIQPGAVIGSCGFGYTTNNRGEHTKLNQVGNVVIEDDVEIGANTTLDRSRFKSTRIGRGTKIDNLVQIAHGVAIGTHNIIVAQTGIAGSSSTGRYVVLGGQVAVAGHLHLGDGVMVAGKSGVTKSLSKGKYGGMPAIPLAEHNRNAVLLRNIEKYINEWRKS